MTVWSEDIIHTIMKFRCRGIDYVDQQIPLLPMRTVSREWRRVAQMVLRIPWVRHGLRCHKFDGSHILRDVWPDSLCNEENFDFKTVIVSLSLICVHTL